MATQRASGLLQRLAQGSLVKQILVGLVLGILLAWISKLRRKRLACLAPCSSAP